MVMGPVFHHRVPAFASALLASFALALLAVAGTTCSFLTVSATNGELLITDVQAAVSSLDIGILCESEYFESEGDTFWTLSRAFLIVCLVIGSICTILGWLLSTVIPPTDSNWKVLSIGTALTAVLQVPIFLLFEAEPCSDYDENQCSVSLGVFLMIGSTTFWVAVTLLTQCIDPPRWAIELDAWKVQKRQDALNAHSDALVAGSEIDDSMDQMLIMQQYAVRSKTASPWIVDVFRSWLHKKRWAFSLDLPIAATESASQDEEVRGIGAGDIKYLEAGSYYADSNNSRLVLKVTSEGKRIGDDQRSVTTFGDLDDFVKFAEDDCIPSSPSSSHLMSDESDVEENSRLLGEELLLSDCDHGLTIGVRRLGKTSSSPKRLQAEGKVVQEEEMFPPALYTEEPLFYSDPNAFHSSNVSENEFVSDKQGSSLPSAGEPENSNVNRINLVFGIRALTERMKRDVSRRMKNGKTYAVIDDDVGSGISSRRSQSATSREGNEVEVGSRSSSQETSDKSSVGGHAQASENRQLAKDWNVLFDDANAGIVISSHSQSSGEDDPEVVYYSSEDAPTSVSMLSFGAKPIGEDESSLSSSSMSDTSDSEVQIDLSLRTRQKRSRLRRRPLRRSRSAGNSVASRTSLLDTTIDEETDFDLRELESSDDENFDMAMADKFCSDVLENTHPLVRTKSAPEVGFMDPELSSSWMQGGDTCSLSGFERRKLHLHRLRQQAFSHTYPDSASGPLQYVSVTDDMTSSMGEGSSGVLRMEGYVTSTDDEDCSSAIGNRRRCRSLSLCRRRGRSSSRHERLYKDGIHNPLVGDVTDDESSSDEYSESEAGTEIHSTRSTLSHRARRARVRRLQSESEKFRLRRRARTLDPPKNRWRSLSPESHDPSPLVIRIEPSHIQDYGPDEASL